ncbi:MAG: hypothetical protein PQJ46_03210, partial [Spirochaetales bacterium]|nr:hypothetical protein [Spirochaetales bacterium]
VSGISCFALDFDYSGNLGYFMEMDDNTNDSTSNLGKVRLNLTASGDYNTAIVQLRNDGMNGTTITASDMYIKYAYLKTDIAAIFALDNIGITTRFGKFEEWATNWNYATSTHREMHVEESWCNGNVSDMGQAAINVDVGAIGFLAYANFTDNDFTDVYYKAGIYSGSAFPVEGLNFFASFSGGNDDMYVKADMGYSMTIGDGIGFYIPVDILYEITDSDLYYGSGVKVSNIAGLIDFNFGIGGDTSASDNYVSSMDAELYVRPIDNAAIFAKLYTSPTNSTTGFFNAVDFGGKYKFDMMTFYMGYVYAAEKYTTAGDGNTLCVCEDDSTSRYGVYGSGFYLAAKLDF